MEPTKIRRSQKLIGAYYRNELARRLQALGMAVAPRMVGPVPGFELAGYERSFIDAFSGRRRAILEYLEQKELPYTAENTQKAALRTRRRKEDRTLADLVPEWRARAQALGLVRERMALRPPRPLDPLTGERVRSAARARTGPAGQRDPQPEARAGAAEAAEAAPRRRCRRGGSAPHRRGLPGAGGAVAEAGAGRSGGGGTGGGACRGEAHRGPGGRDPGGGAGPCSGALHAGRGRRGDRTACA